MLDVCIGLSQTGYIYRGSHLKVHFSLRVISQLDMYPRAISMNVSLGGLPTLDVSLGGHVIS